MMQAQGTTCVCVAAVQLDQVAGVEDKHHFKRSAKDEGAAPRERVVR